MPESKRYRRVVLVLLTPLSVSTLYAENRFFLEDAIVPLGAPGEIVVHCEHDPSLLAFSISMRYTPGELDVTDVTTAGTSVEGLPVFFEQGNVLPAQGGITYGFALEVSAERFAVLPPSADRTLVRVDYRATGAPGTVSALRFEDGVELNGPIRNTITDEFGSSIRPLLESGRVTIFDPEIDRTRVRLASSSARQIDGGARLVLFDGRIIWPATSEEGIWTGVTFEGSGNGDESALLSGASLFVDDDNDGFPDSEELLTARSPVPSDDRVEFVFPAEALTASQPLRFLLVADVAQESGKEKTALLVPFAILALGGLGKRCLGSSRGPRLVTPLLTALCLLALVTACSSGGDGSPQATEIREVGFTLTMLEVAGGRTGARGGLDGAVAGPKIAL